MALLIVVFAILIPFFIVSNTIRLIIHSKRHVLLTLRLLGDKDFFIKLPFIFQGIWQGKFRIRLESELAYILSPIGQKSYQKNLELPPIHKKRY